MKKLIALLFAILILLSLAACGRSSSDSGSEAASSAPASSASASVSGGSDKVESTTSSSAEITADAAKAEPASTKDADFNGDMYAYYALLNNNQKAIYCQIVEAVGQGISEIEPQVNVTTEEFNQLIQAVYLDQPQLFWMNDSWNTSYDSSTDYVISASVGFNSLADDLDANISAFNAAADEILSTLDGMTDAEKERAVHDYLVSTVDYESGTLDQTAYSALVDHTAVCEGYTRAFQYLMLCAGIPTYVAEGKAVNSQTGNWEDHAWNIVMLGSDYYNVDVTWDDPLGNEDSYVHYSYYNRTDADLSDDHTRGELSSDLPACDAVEYSFENLYGMPAELGVTEEMGLTRNEPISSLDAFYQALQEDITASGIGTHTYSYALVGDEVMNSIATGMDNGEFFDSAIRPAINIFGLNGYSYSCSGSYIDLGSGYYYESLEITIN